MHVPNGYVLSICVLQRKVLIFYCFFAGEPNAFRLLFCKIADQLGSFIYQEEKMQLLFEALLRSNLRFGRMCS